MKTISLLALLCLTSQAHAFFFPGSTLEIKQDAEAIYLTKDQRMLGTTLIPHAIFSEGINLTKIPAMTASTEFCLIQKEKELGSLEGFYISNGYGFSSNTLVLSISCFKARFNNYNSSYIPEAVNVDANLLSRALGGYAELKLARAENFQVGAYTFTTGFKKGKEVYGDSECSTMTYKAGSKVKILFSGRRASCSMDVESWTMFSKPGKGEYLKIEGRGTFIGVETKCSMEFEVKNGQLTGRALQTIQHNNSGSYCQY